jgi:hypothetical protein
MYNKTYLFLTAAIIINASIFVNSAVAQSGCTQEEYQTIQQYSQLAANAAYNFGLSGNFEYMNQVNQLNQEMVGKLSPDCYNSLSQNIAQPQYNPQQPYYGPGGDYYERPRNIYDLGGGGYSSPYGAVLPGGGVVPY